MKTTKQKEPKGSKEETQRQKSFSSSHQSLLKYTFSQSYACNKSKLIERKIKKERINCHKKTLIHPPVPCSIKTKQLNYTCVLCCKWNLFERVNVPWTFTTSLCSKHEWWRARSITKLRSSRKKTQILLSLRMDRKHWSLASRSLLSIMNRIKHISCSQKSKKKKERKKEENKGGNSINV